MNINSLVNKYDIWLKEEDRIKFIGYNKKKLKNSKLGRKKYEKKEKSK